MQDVVWKPVVGFEGLYEISSLGEVRSLDKTVTYYDPRWNHQTTRYNKGKLLALTPNLGGYLFVYLRKNGEYHSRYVHRLVAEAFIPNPKNKSNNCVDNLEWVTAKENTQHLTDSEYDWGAHCRGRHLSNEHKRKLSIACKGRSSYVRTAEWREKMSLQKSKPVRCVEAKETYVSVSVAASYYNVTPSAIYRAMSHGYKVGKKWTFVFV